MNDLDGMEKGLTVDSLVLATSRSHRAIRAFVATGGRGGWRGRGDSLGSYETREWSSSRPTSGLPASTACRRRQSGRFGRRFWPSRSFHSSIYHHRRWVVSPTGMNVDVMVIDCSLEVLNHMRAFTYHEDLVYNFDEDSPYALPSMDTLLPRISTWVSQAVDMRVGFYTPEEAEEEEVVPSAQRRRRQPAEAMPTGGGARPKRPTTASLATEMRGILDPIPQITQHLTQMSERQTLLENRLALAPLLKPPAMAVGSALTSSLPGPPPPVSDLVKSLRPPPRTQERTGLGLLASPGLAKQLEVEELAEEKLEGSKEFALSPDSALAQASLVAQIANAQSDPMSELTSSSSSAGTRGAATRSCLQLELAQHKGLFFQSVLQSMSRMTAPTNNPSVSAAELLERGISGVRYLERFGGYGRARELGQIQYQVMMIFDFLMAENFRSRLIGGYPGAICPRWWQDGVGDVAVLTRGSSLEHLREPPTIINLESTIICPPRRSEVDHLCPSLPQRYGSHFKPARRVEHNCKASFRCFVRWLCSTKSQSETAAKEEGQRKRSPASCRGNRRLSEKRKVSHGGRIHFGEEEQEPNPLSSRISFHTWAICLPRWILGCRTHFS